MKFILFSFSCFLLFRFVSMRFVCFIELNIILNEYLYWFYLIGGDYMIT